MDPSHASKPGLSWFCCRSPNLTRISWHGSNHKHICIDGTNFVAARNLTELYLDESAFITSSLRHAFGTTANDENFYILHRCRRLERVSMKNTSYFEDAQSFPVIQEMLIRFVRRTPTFPWFRSDLTAENIIMLRQERPEVTFVAE